MIPKEKSVVIVEPNLLSDGTMLDHRTRVFTKPSGSRELREALRYNVIIHIHEVEDFSSLAEQCISFAPLSDDFGFDGLLDNDFDESEPCRHTFRTTPRVVDGSLRHAGGREEGLYRRWSHLSSSTPSWKLPPLSAEGRGAVREVASSFHVSRGKVGAIGGLPSVMMKVAYQAVRPTRHSPPGPSLRDGCMTKKQKLGLNIVAPPFSPVREPLRLSHAHPVARLDTTGPPSAPITAAVSAKEVGRYHVPPGGQTLKPSSSSVDPSDIELVLVACASQWHVDGLTPSSPLMPCEQADSGLAHLISRSLLKV